MTTTNLCAKCMLPATHNNKIGQKGTCARCDRKEAENPKERQGDLKAPMDAVPVPVMFETGLAMLEGAREYGRHNYRDSKILASTYYSAFMRHVAAWWEGESIDPKSGLDHKVKAIACLAILRDAERRGMLIDDRPPATESGWLEDLAKQANLIRDRIPDPKPPHTHVQAPTASRSFADVWSPPEQARREDAERG